MAESLGTAVLDLTTNPTALIGGMKTAQAGVSGVFSGMGASAVRFGAVGAAALAGVAVGKFVGDGIKAAGDFESALNVLWASADHTGVSMKDLSDKAIALGADAKLPSVSAKDAADAMLQLAKSGFSAKQSMEAVRGTLLLATAAETDGANAAHVVTQNINAFGLKAKDTSVIVDNMAGFMNQTGSSFDAFTDSLSYVAAPAHTVGQNFKDTAAQLAILSQNGIEGSMAGTGLRQVLVRLGSGSGKAHDALKDLGIETIGADGKFIGIRKTIEKLHPVLEGMTSAQRLTLMKEAFGQTAMNQANILLGTLPAKYDKVAASIGKQGQANDLAAAHTKGFNGAMNQLGSAVETLEIQVGLKLLPMLTRLVMWFTNNMPAMATAVGNAFTAIQTYWDANLRPTFDAIVTLVTFMVGVIRDNWDSIANLIRARMQVIQGVIQVITGILTGDWQQAWDGILNIFYGTWNSIVSTLQLAIGIFMSVFGGLLSSIGSAITGAVGGIVTAAANLATGILNAIVNGLSTLVTRVAGVISGVASSITGAVAGLTATALGLGTAIVTGAINGLANLASRVLTGIGVIATTITGWLGTAESTAVHIGERVITGVTSGLAGIGAKALGVINDIIQSITGWLGTVKDSAERIGERIISGVLSGLTGIGKKALDVINNVIDEVKQVAQDVWGWAANIGQRIISGILSGLGGLYSALKSALTSTAKSVLTSPWNLVGLSPLDHAAGETIGMPLAQGAIDGWMIGIQKLKPAMQDSIRGQLMDYDNVVLPPKNVATPTSTGADRPINLTQNFHEVPADADPDVIGAVTSYSLKTLAA